MGRTPMLRILPEDHHWWFATRTRAILAFLDRYLGAGGGRRILDVGCGAGNMVQHLRHYGTVVGVDTNPLPLSVARERGMEAYEAGADELPFAEGKFDLVTLLDTLEHVPDQDAALRECRRVLKRGGNGRAGKLLVTAPAFMFLWSNNDVLNGHQRRYTAAELRAKLVEHGFRVVGISYNNFFIFPAAVALILLRRGRAEPQLATPATDTSAYQVEMEPASPVVNLLLDLLGRVESALLRRVSLPFGTSLIVIAERAG